jgi:hypothetical protein
MSKSLKSLDCSRCGIEVPKVSLDAVQVLCWLCSMKNTSYYENPDGETDSRKLPENTEFDRHGD